MRDPAKSWTMKDVTRIKVRLITHPKLWWRLFRDYRIATEMEGRIVYLEKMEFFERL